MVLVVQKVRSLPYSNRLLTAIQSVALVLLHMRLLLYSGRSVHVGAVCVTVLQFTTTCKASAVLL